MCRRQRIERQKQTYQHRRDARKYRVGHIIGKRQTGNRMAGGKCTDSGTRYHADQPTKNPHNALQLIVVLGRGQTFAVDSIAVKPNHTQPAIIPAPARNGQTARQTTMQPILKNRVAICWPAKQLSPGWYTVFAHDRGHQYHHTIAADNSQVIA